MEGGSPLHFRWNSSKAPGLGSDGSFSCFPDEAEDTGVTAGMVKPAGTETNPGPAWTGGGGLGELAANTLPMLRSQVRDRGATERTLNAKCIITGH